MVMTMQEQGCGREPFALRVVGNSMSPEFKDGCIIIIDPEGLMNDGAYVLARGREVVVVCRSGNHSALAAYTMQQMGYTQVSSMKTGLRGWNDYELLLADENGQAVPVETADEFFTAQLRPDQKNPGD